MKTTIEIYTIQIRKGRDFMDFGSDPDFFNVISDNNTGFVHFVDSHSTGDVESLSRTVRIPPEYVTDDGDTIKFHHKNSREDISAALLRQVFMAKSLILQIKMTH